MHTAPASPSAPLNLRQIEVFHAIMVTGSLSEAGRMLCVSQPSVSRVLATAESRLRFPLFERVRGRLQPTPEARRLFAEVEGIVAGVSQFNHLARSLAQGTEGRLSLVSSPSYAEWLMPRAISRFRDRHPDVMVSYRPLPFDALIPHVLLGRADLCVSSMAPPASSNLVAKEIAEGHIMCAIPTGHALARLNVVTAADLRAHTLIGYGADSPFGQLTAPFLVSADVRPGIEIRSTPEALSLVRQGVGVALVESFGFTSSLSDAVQLRPIAPALAHKIYLIHARNSPLSQLSRGFAATLRHLLEQEAPVETALDLLAA